MNADSVRRLQRSYLEISERFGVGTSRSKPWPVANDALLLEPALSNIDRKTDRVLDFGCSGWPWITNHLRRMDYDVVGLDIRKSEWFEQPPDGRLDLPLVAYDGHRIPMAADSFDAVLLFGVLEHVGVWRDDGAKYRELNEDITEHRRAILSEIDRILAPGGMFYLTKFPNLYGRDKLTSRIRGGREGHLDSERGRPSYLRDLLSEWFSVERIFANGLLPLRVPLATDSLTPARWYATANHTMSNLPGLYRVAQNYCAIARQAPE